MIKVITTRYGQLVAKVNKEAGFTEILNEDMSPVAKVQQTSKEGVVRSINLISSYLNRKRLLQANGITLEAGAEQLESIDSESFTDEAEPTPATEVTEDPTVVANPPRAVKPAAANGRRKGAKRGRKPGQKVKRNPDLTWG